MDRKHLPGGVLALLAGAAADGTGLVLGDSARHREVPHSQGGSHGDAHARIGLGDEFADLAAAVAVGAVGLVGVGHLFCFLPERVFRDGSGGAGIADFRCWTYEVHPSVECRWTNHYE